VPNQTDPHEVTWSSSRTDIDIGLNGESMSARVSAIVKTQSLFST